MTLPSRFTPGRNRGSSATPNASPPTASSTGELRMDSLSRLMNLCCRHIRCSVSRPPTSRPPPPAQRISIFAPRPRTTRGSLRRSGCLSWSANSSRRWTHHRASNAPPPLSETTAPSRRVAATSLNLRMTPMTSRRPTPTGSTRPTPRSSGTGGRRRHRSQDRGSSNRSRARGTLPRPEGCSNARAGSCARPVRPPTGGAQSGDRRRPPSEAPGSSRAASPSTRSGAAPRRSATATATGWRPSGTTSSVG